MKTTQKHDKQVTINLTSEARTQLEKIAVYYCRSIADTTRLLLMPSIINEYAKIQAQTHSENAQTLKQAIFKK